MEQLSTVREAMADHLDADVQGRHELEQLSLVPRLSAFGVSLLELKIGAVDVACVCLQCGQDLRFRSRRAPIAQLADLHLERRAKAVLGLGTLH